MKKEKIEKRLTFIALILLDTAIYFIVEGKESTIAWLAFSGFTIIYFFSFCCREATTVEEVNSEKSSEVTTPLTVSKKETEGEEDIKIIKLLKKVA